MFTKAHRRAYTHKPFYRAGNRTLDKNVRALKNTIVQESTGGCDFAGVFTDLQDTLVEFCTLLISQLTHLGYLPPYMVRIPGAKGTEMTLFPTNRVFSLTKRDTPALYCTVRTLSCSDSGYVGICTGLDDVIQGRLLFLRDPLHTPTVF